MSDNPECTEACRASVDCTVCRMHKKPYGRSAPLPMAGGLCDSDCPGYNEPPRAPHLWPGELIGDEQPPGDED